MKSYSPEFKQKVVEEVKKGYSYKSVSEKFNIPITTVLDWCKKQGVKSVYTMPRFKTDKEIIDAIKKRKVATMTELAEDLGYSNTAFLSKRLKKLIIENQIQYKIIQSKNKKNPFSPYLNSKLFYINSVDFEKWVKKKLPKHLPPTLKRIFTHMFRDAGISITFPSTSKTEKYLPLNMETYEYLKEKAEKEGKTIKQYLEDQIRE